MHGEDLTRMTGADVVDRNGTWLGTLSRVVVDERAPHRPAQWAVVTARKRRHTLVPAARLYRTVDGALAALLSLDDLRDAPHFVGAIDGDLDEDVAFRARLYWA